LDKRDELICLGCEDKREGGDGRPLGTSIVQSAPFAYARLEDLADALAHERTRSVYSRGRNPTVRVLEDRLAALERAEAGLCFASGMGAVSGVLTGLLDAGDHIVFVNGIYGPTMELARRLTRFGIRHSHVIDPTDGALEAAIRPETRLIFCESPGTMTFREIDLAGVTAIARERGIVTAIDNSWATPLFQKPIRHGVDLVIHSLSKYIGGHNDVLGGAVLGSVGLIERIFRDAYMLNGAAMSAQEAFLILRGLKTLPGRMRRIGADALTVARMLAAHGAVAEVFHPALASGGAIPGQLSDPSGLFAFVLRDGSPENVCRVVNGLKRFHIAVSWGGTESLVVAPIRGGVAQHRAHGIPEGLVRLSIGLEGADVLIADLEQALGASL